MASGGHGGQQLIVVVTSSDGREQGTDEHSDSPDGKADIPPSKRDRKRGKGQPWEEVCTVLSKEALRDWLKESEASGSKWAKKRNTSTSRGQKQYFKCSRTGCLTQLEILFDNTSESIVISSNGIDHHHEKQPHSGWGLPEDTKKEVIRLFRSGVSVVTRVEAQLKKKGITGHSLKQLNAFLVRLRRQSREKSAVEAYSEFSIWSRGGRVSPKAESPTRADSPLGSTASVDSSHAGMDESVVRRLVESSAEARRFSYSPYSKFAVGAALLCADGSVVTGCNVENASYGLTNCAERTAVFKAVSEGRSQFTAVAVMADMGEKFVGPCGACRQVLAEFNAEMPVIMAKPNGETKMSSMSELLPDAFMPSHVPFKK